MAKGGGKVVIIKKIKKAGHGHHGGSWKVAYADFVTAMMAFFMVMWILGMDESTRQAIEGYFSNPIGFKKGYSSGSSPLSSGASPASVKQQAMQLALRSLQQKQFEAITSTVQPPARNSRWSCCNPLTNALPSVGEIRPTWLSMRA